MDDLDVLSLYEWDFVDSPSSDYKCGHCEDVFRKPMLLECCGNHFCSKCIIGPQDGINICPDCDENNVNAISDKRKWQKILAFHVKCPFSKNGCTWVGELGKRATHIDTMSGDCEYSNTECKYGCGEKLERHQISEHVQTFCVKRPVECSFCNEIGEYKHIQDGHKNECPELPVNCPNSCGIGELKQKDLSEHLLDCLLQTNECEFRYAGCKHTLQKRNLDAHFQKDSIVHLAMVTTFFASELQHQDMKLKTIVEDKDTQLKELTESYENELKIKDQIIEQLTIDREQQVLARLKDKEKEIDQALENLVENFESKYAELKQNLNRLDHLPTEISMDIENEKVELVSVLHRSKNNVEIWKGKYNGMEVAIKRPLPGSSPSEILLEAHILRKLKSKNILKMLAAITTGEPVCMILEYMSHGTLEDFININSPLLLHMQISLCKQVASGLHYLQQKLCIHRRIRIDNVLIGDNNICKITDFSSAVFLQNHDEEYMAAKGLKLRIKWCAPEVLKQKRFCIKSDVWSYGILVWQVLANGREPYPSLTTTEAQNHISSGAHMLRPSVCPESFYTLMLDCWKMDPWSRPTFTALMDLLDRVKDSHKYTQIDL